MNVLRSFNSAAAVMLAFVGSASAATINFDDQGLVGPSFYASVDPRPQPLNLSAGGLNVSFGGGVILTNTSALPVNQTSVYGTSTLVSGMFNPITIDFSAPITNFLIDVLNGQTTTVDYRVSDNAGNSSVFSLAPNLSSGASTIGFAASGTQVLIESISAPTTDWNFLVDNIRFNTGIQCDLGGCVEVATIPVPGALPLLAAGLALLGAGTYRRRTRQV